MKRIMFILISIAIFFTACINVQKESAESQPESTAPAQIDSEEEFGGVKFGMTKEEVFDIVDSQPNNPSFDIDTVKIIGYSEDLYFNENYGIYFDTLYCFDDNDLLYKISSWYHYTLDGSHQEQIKTDYESIKKELFKRYPIEICTDFHNKDTEMTLDTENRHILVFYDDFQICIAVENVENTDQTDSPES